MNWFGKKKNVSASSLESGASAQCAMPMESAESVHGVVAKAEVDDEEFARELQRLFDATNAMEQPLQTEFDNENMTSPPAPDQRSFLFESKLACSSSNTNAALANPSTFSDTKTVLASSSSPGGTKAARAALTESWLTDFAAPSNSGSASSSDDGRSREPPDSCTAAHRALPGPIAAMSRGHPLPALDTISPIHDPLRTTPPSQRGLGQHFFDAFHHLVHTNSSGSAAAVDCMAIGELEDTQKQNEDEERHGHNTHHRSRSSVGSGESLESVECHGGWNGGRVPHEDALPPPSSQTPEESNADLSKVHLPGVDGNSARGSASFVASLPSRGESRHLTTKLAESEEDTLSAVHHELECLDEGTGVAVAGKTTAEGEFSLDSLPSIPAVSAAFEGGDADRGSSKEKERTQQRDTQLSPQPKTQPASSPSSPITPVVPPLIMPSNDEKEYLSVKSEGSSVAHLFKGTPKSIPAAKNDDLKTESDCNINCLAWSSRSCSDSVVTAKECVAAAKGWLAAASVSQATLLSDIAPADTRSRNRHASSPRTDLFDVSRGPSFHDTLTSTMPAVGDSCAKASPSTAKLPPSVPSLISSKQRNEWEGLPHQDLEDTGGIDVRPHPRTDTRDTLVMERNNDHAFENAFCSSSGSKRASAVARRDLPLGEWCPLGDSKAPVDNKDRDVDNDGDDGESSFVCALPSAEEALSFQQLYTIGRDTPPNQHGDIREDAGARSDTSCCWALTDHSPVNNDARCLPQQPHETRGSDTSPNTSGAFPSSSMNSHVSYSTADSARVESSAGVARRGMRSSSSRRGDKLSARTPSSSKTSAKIQSSTLVLENRRAPPHTVPPRPMELSDLGPRFSTGGAQSSLAMSSSTDARAARHSVGTVPDSSDTLVEFLEGCVEKMEKVCDAFENQKAEIETQHQQLMREVHDVLHTRSSVAIVARPSRELIELERYVNALGETASDDDRKWQTWSCFDDTTGASRDNVIATPRPLQVQKTPANGLGKPPIPPAAAMFLGSQSKHGQHDDSRSLLLASRQPSGTFPLWVPAALNASQRENSVYSRQSSVRADQCTPNTSLHASHAPSPTVLAPHAPTNGHTFLTATKLSDKAFPMTPNSTSMWASATPLASSNAPLPSSLPSPYVRGSRSSGVLVPASPAAPNVRRSASSNMLTTASPALPNARQAANLKVSSVGNPDAYESVSVKVSGNPAGTEARGSVNAVASARLASPSVRGSYAMSQSTSLFAPHATPPVSSQQRGASGDAIPSAMTISPAVTTRTDTPSSASGGADETFKAFQKNAFRPYCKTS